VAWEFAEKNNLKTLRSYHSYDYGNTSAYIYIFNDFTMKDNYSCILTNTLKKPSLKIYTDYLSETVLKLEPKYLRRQEKLRTKNKG
jgi:hypothetical protein